MTFKFAIAALAGLCLFAPPVAAQQPGIVVQDVKVQMFLERTGALSENIVGAKKAFHNTPVGEGDAGEPAESLLITLVLQGPKNSKASDKLARDLAAVKVTQAGKAGPKVLLNRPFGGFLFGESGLYHKAMLIDNATCAPIEIEARIGRSRKVVKVDFTCAQ